MAISPMSEATWSQKPMRHMSLSMSIDIGLVGTDVGGQPLPLQLLPRSPLREVIGTDASSRTMGFLLETVVQEEGATGATQACGPLGG